MGFYYFPYSSLINAVTSFILGFFVLLRNFRSSTNRSFFYFTISAGIWTTNYCLWLLSKQAPQALFYIRSAMVGAILIPVTFVYFTTRLLNQDKKFLNRINFILAGIFICFSFNPAYIQKVEPRLFFPFWPVPGYLFHLMLLYFALNTIYAHANLWKGIKKTYGIEKLQIKYVFFGTLIGFISGSTNYFLWYNIPIPPYPNILVSAYIFCVAYAIVRHQLMDIEVLIKKSLVFAGMFAFAFGVFVVSTLLVSQFVGGSRIISLAISALIITIGLRPLETFLVNSTDKFLFQKKYEYKQILKAFIDEVITVLNLDEIVSSTLELLEKTLHPYASVIFILNKAEDKYQLYNSKGLENKELIFTSDSKLINFFKKSHQPAVIRQIDGFSGVGADIQREMLSLKAVICLPLMLHDDLIGFISLGRKRSDEDYTKDDLDVLLDLARTESIAVGNAQLLTEAAQNERRAAIGTMAAGINHEIGNPLNIMSTKIQIFKLARQKGLLQNKSNEEILNEAEAALDECLKQSGRISEITRKLSNFAKPSKEFKPQVISIPNEIEETLAVVGHDLELERIKIEKQFSQDLFKILADRQEIQQIFFNLIRNAGQAIEGTGTITVSAVNTVNNKVHIEIQDTGKGIAEDKVNRIFEPFFTTKGPAKGTGLGLSIVRQLVWRNKGEISFKSQVGTGTTFILEFPKAQGKI